MAEDKMGSLGSFPPEGDMEGEEAVKICASCGHNNNAKANFCVNCGNNLKFTQVTYTEDVFGSDKHSPGDEVPPGETDISSKEVSKLYGKGRLAVGEDDDYVEAESLEVARGEIYRDRAGNKKVKGQPPFSGKPEAQSIDRFYASKTSVSPEKEAPHDRQPKKGKKSKIAAPGDEVYEVRMAFVPFRTTAAAQADRKRKVYKTVSPPSQPPPRKKKKKGKPGRSVGRKNDEFFEKQERKRGEEDMFFEKEDAPEKEARPVLNQTLKKNASWHHSDAKDTNFDEKPEKKRTPEMKNKPQMPEDVQEEGGLREEAPVLPVEKKAAPTLPSASPGKKEHSTPPSAPETSPSSKAASKEGPESSPTSKKSPEGIPSQRDNTDSKVGDFEKELLEEAPKKTAKKGWLISKIPGINSKVIWKRRLSVLYYLAILFLVLMAVIRGDYVTIVLIIGLGLFFIGVFGLTIRIINKAPFRYYVFALLVSFFFIFIGDALQPEAILTEGERQEAPEEADLEGETEDSKEPELPPVEDVEEIKIPVEEDEVTTDPDDETDPPDEPEFPLLPEHERDTSRSILFD